jgi:hypothetical protein
MMEITPKIMLEESSPVVKFVPGTKTKILSFMTPFVVALGIVMIVIDYFDVANAKEQNAQKAGILLLAYAIYSFRGLHRYRTFLELHPDKILWSQGFGPFTKRFTIKYPEIESLTVTPITTNLLLSLKQGSGLPRQLRLAPSFRRSEGMLAKPEKEIASSYPAVREIYYLKDEIEKRIRVKTAY